MPKGDLQRKLTSAQIDQIVQRYTTKLPDGTWEGTTSLAKEFGVRPATIGRWLRLRGVLIRSHREAHSGGKRCRPVKNLPDATLAALHVSNGTTASLMTLPGGPLCKCGCGTSVPWNRRANQWTVYTPGHYRNARDGDGRPTGGRYKDEAWLREQYVTKRRSLTEIARENNVSATTICRYIAKFAIPAQPIDHSRQGSPGARNGSWKGGVAQWPYSPDWKALARKIRSRDKWTCQDCGEQRKRWGVYLHVHHVDGNKLNNDPANLISLCAACHRERHRLGGLGEIEENAA
jgi:hypothetical protein